MTRLRRSGLVVAIAVVLPVVLLLVAPGVYAKFTGSPTAGVESVATATLPAVGPVNAVNGGCSGGSAVTNVSLSWSAPAAPPDGSTGGALVTGYRVFRATATLGPFSSIGTTGGTTSYTDTSPSGAPTPTAFVVGASGTATGLASINTATNALATVTGVGAIGFEPNALAATPDAQRVVVAEGASHQVQVVAVSSNSVQATIAVPAVGAVASKPVAVAVSPNGTAAFVVDSANARLYPLTLATDVLGTPVAVGTQGDPTALVIVSAGNALYVANFGSHSVTEVPVNPANGQLGTPNTIPIGGASGRPIALVATPNGAHVYVADQGNNQVDDIATSTNTVVKVLSVTSLADPNVTTGGDPNIMAATLNSAHVYVASYNGVGAGTVTDIATPADTTSTIALPSGGVLGTPAPNALALTPSGCQLYVDDYNNNKVDVVSTATDTVTASPAVGQTGDPMGIVATPNSALVYSGNYYDPSVSVISTTSNTVSGTVILPAGSAPEGIAVTPSIYYYNVSTTNNSWVSAASSVSTYVLGWNTGDWQ